MLVTNEFEEANAKLAPPQKLRGIKPRSCATCRYARNTDGFGYCVRPGGPSWDVGDMKQWLQVCNGYKSDDDLRR